MEACELSDVAAAGGAAAAVWPPVGWVDKDGAAKRFGMTGDAWQEWIRRRGLSVGQPFAMPRGGMCHLYRQADVERLWVEHRGPDALYQRPRGQGSTFHVPEGMVGQRDAWAMFGVDRDTWMRWEREGRVRPALKVPGKPKLYRVAELEQMVSAYGRYAPPYPDPQRPGVYRLPLSGWDIRRREALIDAEALAIVAGYRWCWAMGSGRAREAHGYVTRSCDDATPLRRLIMGVTDATLTVMHLNDDPLDCRRANLVVRTRSQLGAASRKPPFRNGGPCSSRFKGVTWSKERGKWVAQIKAEGRQRPIGRFRDELAAAQAYDEAARAAWGEHARLNFPDGVDAWLASDAARNDPREAAPNDVAEPTEPARWRETDLGLAA